MTHLEGPIVDSFYDMALCSWSKELKPPLPCSIKSDPQIESSKITQSGTEHFDQRTGQHSDHRLNVPISNLFQDLAHQLEDPQALQLPEHTEKDPHYDTDIGAEVKRSLSVLKPRGSERRVDAITRHLSKAEPSHLGFRGLMQHRYHYPAQH